MNTSDSKPVIGITSGDINGIGLELIIKTFADHRMLDVCTPIIFATNKTLNFYRKSLPDIQFSFSAIKDNNRANPKQVNLFNCWEEEVNITPGELTDAGGSYAVQSLVAASAALKKGSIDGLVTAPIHKKNVQSQEFSYSGHTCLLYTSPSPRD